MRPIFSDTELKARGLKPNGSVKKTLRYSTATIAARSFKVGDMVEAVDKTASPYGRVPHRLTVGKRYEVTNVRECVIEVLNDVGHYVFYYANRFKKVEEK